MDQDIFTLKKQCLTCGAEFITRRKEKKYHNYVCGYNYRNNMSPIKNAAHIQRRKDLNLSDSVLEKYIDEPSLLPLDIKLLKPLGLNQDVYTQIERISAEIVETVFHEYAFQTHIDRPNHICKIIKK